MTTHIRLSLDDVVHAGGGVEEAIQAWCAESGHTSTGIVGPSFATSGPGPGWSRHYDVDDFARRAAEEGALYYVDWHDGRMVEVETVDDDERGEDGEWPDDVIFEMGGDRCRLGGWSDASVVELVCPDFDEAIQPDHIAAVAAMARAVIAHHYAESDCAAWRRLIETIRTAGEAVADIAPDDFAAR